MAASARVPSARSISSSVVRCMTTLTNQLSEFFLAGPPLQVPERVEEICLDGADRASKHIRDFLMRHLVVHPQDQRRPLLSRQFRDRGAHARAPFFLQQAF